MSFSRDIQKFTEKAKRNHEQLVRGVKTELFTAVVKDTPVDTGRLRGNWQATLNKKAAGKLGKRSEGAVMSEIMANLGDATDTSYLTNNLPYAPVIEYGQYPNPSKDDSGKTVSGYSRKAPEGMVRRNVARFQRLVNQQVRKLKR